MESESLTAEYSAFNSASDFSHFRRMIESSLDFERVAVLARYSNVGFEESWYRHLPSSKVYRLVEPDGPFRGVWEIVRAERHDHT
jgi:hypothetical protein